MFEPDVSLLVLWDLFIILCRFLAGSCSVKMSQAFHNPSINFHCMWQRSTRLKFLKCAFILTQTFEADVSQLFSLDLFLILSFLPKLTVKWDESSRPKIGQWPATGPYWQHWRPGFSLLLTQVNWEVRKEKAKPALGQVLITAVTYPGFLSIRLPGVFLLSPGWDITPSQCYPPH